MGRAILRGSDFSSDISEQARIQLSLVYISYSIPYTTLASDVGSGRGGGGGEVNMHVCV